MSSLKLLDGRVVGAETSVGLLEADEVVVAASVRMPNVMVPFGLTLPIRAAPALLVRTQPYDKRLKGLVMSPEMQLRQTPQGQFIAAVEFSPGRVDADGTQAATTALDLMKRMIAPTPGSVSGLSCHWRSTYPQGRVPGGLTAFIGGLLFLRDSRAQHAQKLDVGGVLLLSLTLALLVYPLVEGRESEWPTWIIAMLVASPFALTAFARYEARLSACGRDPLVALHLLRNTAFVIGLIMALAFYMLSSFYLTFAVYLQSGLHETPLAAGLATLPFATGFFVASLVSSYVMQFLGVRTLTLGFALQVLGFGVVMLSVGKVLPQSQELGLVCAGLGFGTVMPSVIKAVIGSLDQQHAGLASGIMISTFQIGAALGVAIIGGVFYSALGTQQNPGAFVLALGRNVALLALGGLLSLWLPGGRQAAV